MITTETNFDGEKSPGFQRRTQKNDRHEKKDLDALKFIKIKGAQTHNLKSIDVQIPLGKITCVSGPSGSGKTSLVFHTLHAESKRRFLNSLPSDLKFFTERPTAIKVEEITPVLPVYGLPQSNPIIGSRPNVTDLIGLSEKLQNLFFRWGRPLCPNHHVEPQLEQISVQLEKAVQDKGLDLDQDQVLYLLVRSDEYKRKLTIPPFPSRSFNEASKNVEAFNEEHIWWELVRFRWKNRDSLSEKLKQSFKQIQGPFLVFIEDEGVPFLFNPSTTMKCPQCDFSPPHSFSVASLSPLTALGACLTCKGYGTQLIYDRNKLVPNDGLSIQEGALYILNYKKFKRHLPAMKKYLLRKGVPLELPFRQLPEKTWELIYKGGDGWPGLNKLLAYLESKKYKKNVRIYIRGLQSEILCPECEGTRINTTAQHFHLKCGNEWISYQNLLKSTVAESSEILHKLKNYLGPGASLDHNEGTLNLFNKTLLTLNTAISLGLDHLELHRKSKLLSSGEYQRLLLVKYLSYEGAGSLFIFDEPGLGLGTGEQLNLFKHLRNIADQGNTVLIVEHSEFLKRLCDYQIVMGPEAGERGGYVLYQGTALPPEKEVKWELYKDELEKVSIVNKKRSGLLQVERASIWKIKDASFSLPTEELIWVHGPSGGGKTSLMVNVLADYLHHLKWGTHLSEHWGEVANVKVPVPFQDVLVINSSADRLSGRSTFGSATGLSSVLRDYFCKIPTAISMGLRPGHFSFNSPLGQCKFCEGKGERVIEMHFMEDVVLECEECKGTKLNPLYGNLSDGKFTVNEYFGLPASKVLNDFKLTPKYRRVWEFINILNLSYLSLGRPLSTLSGGERQRTNLLMKLQKEVKNSFIFFENISFGLGQNELLKIGLFLKRLARLGNTIIVIDQSPIFEKLCTYQVCVGPKGKVQEGRLPDTHPSH